MNVGKVLEKTAVRFASRRALIYRDEVISFEELRRKALRLSNGLAGLGIRKGDKVAIMLPNSPEYVVSYLAIFNLRAVAVPLDMGIKDELQSYLRHSDTKCLIAEKPKDSDHSSLLDSVDTLEHVIYRQEQLADLIEKGSEEPQDVEIGDDDPSVIFYTSGTTGRPKGVLWNYRHLDGVRKIVKHHDLINPHDIMVCTIPMSHSAGLDCVICCLVFGMTVVIMERFNPAQFVANIEEYKVTCFFAVPAMLEAVLTLKRVEAMDLSSVRWLAVFGAMSSPLLATRLQSLFAQAVIFGGYGLTETAPPTTLPSLDRIKPGSVGQAPPWVEMRIVDEQDKPVPAGTVGEVVFRGWVVMVEYYRDPEMTSSVMKDGWFHTGDLGKVDEEGYLFLVGRKKEMVIVGGLNVYPEEVEAVLVQHPAVKEAAVIGIEDPLRGEKLKAVVALKEGARADREDIVSYCQRHLPPFKVPRIIEFMDVLPKLASGKIARRQLL